MPYKYPAAVRGYMTPLVVANFNGGLNLRDFPSEIADNESPACENITINARGGVEKRLGLETVGSTGTGSPTVAMSNIFFWQTKNCYIVQEGQKVKCTFDFVTFTLVMTATGPGLITFCEFQKPGTPPVPVLVIASPSDGIWTWDGTATPPALATRGVAAIGTGGVITWTPGSPPQTTIRPTGIAAWQNKVWVIQGPKFYASQNGDPTRWDETNDVNSLYEKDSLPATAIGGGQGMDVSGRPGLLVFKADSTYRINESRSAIAGTDVEPVFFGSYTTVHNHAGASGPLAVITASTGQTCFICQRGIYASDGVSAPVQVSGKLEPFFTDDELNFIPMSKWTAGRWQDRVVFSISRGSSIVNNYTLEYSPTYGWIVPHTFGLAAYTENLQDQKHLIGISATLPKAYRVFHTGADDGVPIHAHWQSRWFEPFGGYTFRMRRLRAVGRGIFNIYTKPDYTVAQGVLSMFQTFIGESVWGLAIWGDTLWGGLPVEAYQDFYSLGWGKSVSFVIDETSDKTLDGPPLNDTGAVLQTGAFALYGLKLDMVRLGYA